MNKKKLLASLINLGLVVILYLVFVVLMDNKIIDRYYIGIITMVFINIILAVSLNLATGVLGQLVLGHAGFMAVGAYFTALFTMNSGLPINISFPIALLFSGITAALFGVLIGIPALRLKGDYLAIITLGFGEIIRVIIRALPFTGGAKGLNRIPFLPKPSWSLFTYVFFVAVLTIFIIFTFAKSRHGRAVIAIREDEIAAEASGINTTYYKLLAFVMAAFFAGIAGGLFANYMGVLNPAKFDFNYSVEILIMVVLGGMGSITGSVISATVLTILPEALRDLKDYRMLLYSLILLAVMLFKPSGLLGRSELSMTKIITKIQAVFHQKDGKPSTKKEG